MGRFVTLEDCRRLLRSDARVVAVEAAAGCGKTFEAAGLAVDCAKELREGQEVLLLAHTHAAINVFRERVSGRQRVRVMTLDAFAHELVAPYARALGLPSPLRMGRVDGVPFERLAPALCDLLRSAPAVRKAVAGHYPVVLLDEHQDARVAQHEIVDELAKCGSRVRFFGDPMQSIFNFGETPCAEWKVLRDKADATAELLVPRRWPQAPRLGQWLADARAALGAGRMLPALAPEVRLMFVDDQADPPPKSTAVPRNVAAPVFRLLDRLEGSVGILVRTRHHAVGLRRAIARSIGIFEGRSAAEGASHLADEALALVGAPQALALLALDALGRFSAGVTKALLGQLARCLLSDRIDRSRQRKLLPTLDVLERLYQSPTATTWCSVVGALVAQPPEGVLLDDPGALYVLGHLDVPTDADLHDALAEITHRVVHRRRPRRCIMTIHMAKGDEFDHVVVPHFGGLSFPDRETERKLLYVAATRARKTLHLLSPRDAPSPLAPGS